MKNLSIVFAIFCAVLVVSCGSSKNDNNAVSNFGKLGQECYPNKTCDEGLLCDTASNICVEDPDNPTDTGSDKPDEQNNQNDQDTPVEQPDENHQENQNDQDTPVEQPDENHQETPNDQDIPVEQPDEDHQETPNDQDTPIEQPDQDVPETPDEQPDQDVPVDPGDVCHGEGCQGNRGCKPGYFWIEKNASNFIETGGDPDYHCVPCTAWEDFAEQLRGGNSYCPGGDDLKGKYVYDQTEQCPEYTFVNDSLSDCICTYGVPLPGEECQPTTRKKPLVIKPKVNSSLK